MIGRTTGFLGTNLDNNKGNLYYNEYLVKLQEYAKQYNNLAQKKSPHLAISILSQNKKEIEEICEQLRDGTDKIINRVWHEIDVSDDLDWAIVKASKIIKMSIRDTFKLPDFNGFDIHEHGFRLNQFDNTNVNFNKAYEAEKKDLIKDLEHFWEVSGETGFNWLVEEINKAYIGKEKLENVLLHQRAIDVIIAKVIFQNYPSNITLQINFLQKDGTKNNKVGRPPEGDQKELEKFVHNLIRKALREENGYAKFWHHQGRHKGKPNKEQITLEILDKGLLGKLGKRQVKRRISGIIRDMTF